MSTYIVRVELHGASGSDYNELHDAMKSSGFSRNIVSSEGRAYQLPTAEYVANSPEEASKVCDIAYSIASRIRPNPSVIASAYSTAAWKGLTPVQ